MKIARFFAVIFACIGIVLLIGSMGFLLLNRNADVRIVQRPQEAVACSDAFAQALNTGDLEAAAKLIYGQPDLGVSQAPGNPETARIWESFCDSIRVELDDEWKVEQSSLMRTGSITTLDVQRMLAGLPKLAQSLLDQRIAAAESLTDIYNEQNDFHEELVEEILAEALQRALTQETQPVTREVTIRLVNRDGGWWVVPDQALLQAITGLA